MLSVKRLVISTTSIFLSGALFHFLYAWLGSSPIAAPFFAVNESVWEHMKMLSTAALIWLAADWLMAEPPLRRRFFSARGVSLPAALLLIPFVHNFLAGALGIENWILDIILFFFACLLYQYLAMRLETSASARLPGRTAGIAILVVIAVLFAVFTFLPPHLPLFMDPPSGGYGLR